MKITTSNITTPIVSYDDVKTYMRLDGDEFRDELLVAIDAATAYVEGECEATFAQRSVVAVHYGRTCGDRYELPRGPVQSVTTITDGHDEEITSSEYEITHVGNAAFVEIDVAYTLPLTITYVSGPATAPADIKVAVLQLIAQMHRHKEPIITGTIVAELPHMGRFILNKYRRSNWVG